jgi:DinB family protein
MRIGRPDRNEAGEYYFTYIDRIQEEDICAVLEAQHIGTLGALRAVTDAASKHRYAPGKWSLREVLGHLNDTERLFLFRAFWFARGFDTPLPSFDQNVAMAASDADARSWSSLIEEFDAVRRGSISLFRSLPADAWLRRGVASGNPFSVRALAYLGAGHVDHHMVIVRDRYLVSMV